MDFSTVKKWIIPEGEVLKVVDSNGDIIWRKSKTNPSWDSPSKKYLAPIATNFNINITDSDSAGWELQSDSSWISISLIGQQTYSGTGNSTSYIYISENDSDIKRTGLQILFLH